METTDPYAPIRPDQEQAIREIAATKTRRVRERILDGLHQLDAGRADDRLRRLRGEPAPPLVVEHPADAAATRAYNAQKREELDSHYAIRRMQPYGLGQPSLLAGLNGTPHSTTR